MKTIQEITDTSFVVNEKDDDTYKSMYLVDTTTTVPLIKVPEITDVRVASVLTEFVNSNRN